MNLFGFLFVRSDIRLNPSERTLNHESIHTAQMKELLYIGFYIIYIIEYILKQLYVWTGKLYNNLPLSDVFSKESQKEAYYAVSFEREAHLYDDDLEYLNKRKSYEWIKMICPRLTEFVKRFLNRK